MHRSSPSVLIAVFALSCGAAWADDATLPSLANTASRYESLWTHSPFAVATPEAEPERVAYTLCGIAQFDGIFYASVIDRESHQHFLLAADRLVQGLMLLSVARGSGTYVAQVLVQKTGQSITLRLGSGPAEKITMPTMGTAHFSRYPGRMVAPAR